MTSKVKLQEQERQNAIKELQAMISKGDTVYTILRNVSKSGMSRRISLKVIHIGKESGKTYIYDITSLASKVLGYGMHRDDHALKVSGCGMDMGFHLVYELGYNLYKDDTDKNDAGYSLNHQWL